MPPGRGGLRGTRWSSPSPRWSPPTRPARCDRARPREFRESSHRRRAVPATPCRRGTIFRGFVKSRCGSVARDRVPVGVRWRRRPRRCSRARAGATRGPPSRRGSRSPAPAAAAHRVAVDGDVVPGVRKRKACRASPPAFPPDRVAREYVMPRIRELKRRNDGDRAVSPGIQDPGR